MNAPDEREARFRSAFLATHDDLLRFVQRRTHTRDAGASADDVVAEAMLVAWRRVDELPTDTGEARAWLFGIARNALLNDARSHRRADALAVRLADTPGSGTHPDDAAIVLHRLDLARAWTHLSPDQQETIALTVLDGLDSAGAGAVLGIGAGAYRLRLSRARAALRAHLDGAPGPASAPASAPVAGPVAGPADRPHIAHPAAQALAARPITEISS